ncbi:uncharacterized protein LOC106645809 [Copidosoma floridanum]|uniref:Cysteine-rich peptide 3 n=1 Tax=Copidosoma floridanum TaxID=29053 RepID=Q2Q1Y5_COPFL|nr:uncharacterized protein LOC106645809 [Copidosoma floridanum]ABB58738.1 cysteine-rich peptide 3 [Copidosoma floridanum]
MRAVLFALFLVALVAYSSAACNAKMCRNSCSALGYKTGICSGSTCHCANLMAQQFLAFDIDELATILRP